MAKNLIDIPDDLLGEAMQALGARTPEAAVRTALLLVTRRHRQREVLDWIAESGVLTELNKPELRSTARR